MPANDPPAPPPAPSAPPASATPAAAAAPAPAAAPPGPTPRTPLQSRRDLPEVGLAPRPSAAPPPQAEVEPGHPRQTLLALSIGALGVVYGDIGTSPLYALKECFSAMAPTHDNVLGILSLVFWALTFVVTFKYLSFVMRADNRDEGGILALFALLSRGNIDKGSRKVLLLLGIFGAALLYGDGIITPAISVLSAVEGVVVAAPSLAKLVVPVTVVILAGLFVIQRWGTGAVGAVFGPVMLLWFFVIAVLGVRGIIMNPAALAALNPVHAVRFFGANGLKGFLVLGSVVLCITGGEALYADMGHFGRRPIRLAWLSVAMPALLLNYFGQGGLLLNNPAAKTNPFFLLAPAWALYPLVAIATVATIIASQALISGAFSLTHQAVQLGYCPRVQVLHTSETSRGQIYIPAVNSLLGIACIALVLGFKSSSALAAAYGIAVTGTMSITTLLFHRVMRDLWRWPRWQAWPLSSAFFLVDMSFFLANVDKIEEGGWFPIAAATGVFAVMSTWKRGREVLGQMLKDAGLPLELFLADLERRKPMRVPGTAVFLTASIGSAPPVMLHHLKHNKVLHKRVLLVSILNEEIPTIPERERVIVRALGNEFWQVIARFGFMERPDIPKLLQGLAFPQPGTEPLVVNPMDTTFYLGRETLLASGPSSFATWRKKLFIFLSRNSATASAFFGLPPNRVVELGAQIEL